MPYVKEAGGICLFCSKFAKPLEFHHTCYDPVRGLKLCHDCHWKIHHQPNLLTVTQQNILKCSRGTNCMQTERIPKEWAENYK